MKPSFKDLNLEMRKAYLGNLVFKNPGQIFAVVSCDPRSGLNFEQIIMPFSPSDKFTKLNEALRKNLKLGSEHSLFYSIQNRIVKVDGVFGDLYARGKAEDGFLYVTAKAMDSNG